jgi:hypothetical protein
LIQCRGEKIHFMTPNNCTPIPMERGDQTMTTNGAVTDFLGQQSQSAQTAGQGQLTEQGLFDAIVRALPAIIQTVQTVVSGQSAGQSFGGQSFGGQSVGGAFGGQSLGGQQAQAGQLDPQGLFDAIVRALPAIIQTVQTVVSGQSVSGQPLGGQSLGGQSLGGQSAVGQPTVGQQGQAGQLDPQFLQFIAPFIPTIISAVGSLLSSQSLTGQSAGGQQGQVDPQGLFDAIFRALPTILQTVQTVVSGQSVSGQSAGGQQGQAGQLDPQFLQFIAPFIPTIISAVGSLISGQSVSGQGVTGQSAVGQQSQVGAAGQLTQQGLFDIIVRALPTILQTVQTVVSGQGVTGQSAVGQQSQVGAAGQLTQQGLFDIIVRALPTILQTVQTVVSGQGVTGQSAVGQPQLMFPPTQRPFMPWPSMTTPTWPMATPTR